jgi:hypothetical protein
LTASVVGGLVLAPAILETDGVVSARTAGGKTQKLDFRAALAPAPIPDCLGKPVRNCTVVSGTGLRVVLLGDSHARMWVPAFRAIARDESWTLSVAVLSECPWQRGLGYGTSSPQILMNCRRHQEDWYTRVVPQLKPDIVILAHLGFDALNFRPPMVLPDDTVGNEGEPRIARGIHALTRSSIRALEATVPKVVIIEPLVRAPIGFDPLDCLSSGTSLDRCTYSVKRPGPSDQELLYRSLDDHRHIWSLNFDRLACPRLPLCDPVLRGLIVKRDGSHLTVKFVKSLAPVIASDLRRAGILAAP